MKLSILIPFKNVEKYIRTCLLSIINSINYANCFHSVNYEIVLLDDDSEDKSMSIAQHTLKDHYNYKDNRVYRFVTSEVTGFDAVRNTLWKESEDSNLIIFIDSDDWISNTYIYNHLNKHLVHPEISASQVANISQFKDNSYIEIQHLGVCAQVCKLNELFPSMVENDTCITPVVWTKMINRQHLANDKRYPYFYMDGLNDSFFTFTHFQLLDTIAIFEDEHGGVFRRYNRENSYMDSLRKSKAGERYIKLIDAILNHYIKYDYSNNIYLPFQFLNLAIVMGNNRTPLLVKDYLLKNKEKLSKFINPHSINALENICKLVDPVNLCSFRGILCN